MPKHSHIEFPRTSFLLTLPTPLRSYGFSFLPTSMGEVYSCLSEGTCHSPHSGPHYTTQDFMQGVEGTVLFFKLQYKQGESVLFPPASAVILNWHGMEKKKKKPQKLFQVLSLRVKSISLPLESRGLSCMTCFCQWNISK